jgi:hypothetical protein
MSKQKEKEKENEKSKDIKCIENFNGKWKLQGKTGQPEDFMMLIGRSFAEAKLAPLCTEIQKMHHFVIDGCHVLMKVSNMNAGFMSISYTTISCMNNEPQTHSGKNDAKGFGEHTVTSKWKGTNGIEEFWSFYLPNSANKEKIQMKTVRTLKGNKTEVHMKATNTFTKKSAECTHLYERVVFTDEDVREREKNYKKQLPFLFVP